MSASARRSSALTSAPSVNMAAIFTADSSYLPASLPMVATSACSSVPVRASTTSRTAIARSCTLPRKLMA